MKIRFMTGLMLAPLALFSVSAAAAPEKKPAAMAPLAKPAPLDPATEAASRAVVNQLWPLGTYSRMMDSYMGDFMDGLTDQILSMRLVDFIPPEMQKDMPKGPEARMTFKEMMAKEDPHFVERMKISMDVMNAEMKPIITKWEPTVQNIMVKSLGRRFTGDQLKDMSKFFATPSGAAFAKEWMVLYLEPDFIISMKDMIPDLIEMGPGIAKKVEKATAHLPMPKPKYPESEVAAAEATEAAAAAAGFADEPWSDPANWTAEERAAYEKADAAITQSVEQQMAISSAATEKAKARMTAAKKAK
jgi:hypothetical protein